MASIASVSAVDPEEERPRPQAGPLPQKRGEIGFQEGIHVQDERQANDRASPLPPRHPADRDREESPLPPPPHDEPSSVPNAQDTPHRPASIAASSDTSSLHKRAEGGRFVFWFKCRRYMRRKKVGGIVYATLGRLILQILLLCGTIAAWVTLALKINDDLKKPSNDSQPDNPDESSSNSAAPSPFSSASIFVHITFAFVTVAQCIFLERCVYYVRAQRYAYVHPGQVLPRHGRHYSNSSSNVSTSMAFAPWNRPPLPTYAAALAQSGVGTGDVEDNEIAIIPPPAYGNTRGSTLLLSNLLRASSRRSQRQPSRAPSRASQRGGDDRPRSRHMDGDWELVDREEAQRALKLAEALESLEAGSARR